MFGDKKPDGANGGITVFETKDLAQTVKVQLDEATVNALHGAVYQTESATNYNVTRVNATSPVNIHTEYWPSEVFGGVGGGTIESGAAGDYLFAGKGDTTLIGKSYSAGEKQIDTLVGNVGNDTLINDGGYVEMTGGLGADKFIVHTDKTNGVKGTTIEDFRPAEGDVIRIEGLTTDSANQVAALANGHHKELMDFLYKQNIRLEKANLNDVQVQAVADSGMGTVIISAHR